MKFSTVLSGLVTACSFTNAFYASGFTNGTTTTLIPSSDNNAASTELTTNTYDSTSTITLMTTVTVSGSSSASSGSISLPNIDGKLVSGASSDQWSYTTSTSYVTETYTASGTSLATTVSAVEMRIAIGTSSPASCVPETVTVTEYQTTQYVTVTAGSDYPTALTSSVRYSNSTATN
ncbi:LAFE_0G08350g1_1 [Lachancea fermentati]|uniref:LAFE_0G08350g1_1 n=1 Tax=Lachancea fermentati TaxID=4955 RepID=A0A1G4MHM2_LACFM|nr:LAFE_0G08350g1_1 [Lachancea fermentati]